MRFPALVIRNLRRRPLASMLTGLSVSLGVGLFASVGALREASEIGFQRSASLCDMLVGAKGSGLQLSLNALYHMGQSQGNVPYEVYAELEKTQGVLWSVPIAIGDSFRSHRIVGVTSNFFQQVQVHSGTESRPLEFAEGEAFAFSPEAFAQLKADLANHQQGEPMPHQASWFQAVLGATVAKRTGMGVGDHFHPTHGVQGAAEEHEDGESEVVGVLAPTGTPVDRAIYLPIGVYYVMQGHEPTADMKAGGSLDPRGLSAIMLHTKAGFYRTQIYRTVNDRLDAMAVYPSVEMRNLFAMLNQGDFVLKWITALIVVVALIGVMVAIYNTMGARRGEFAVLRALGAKRRTILGLVTCESAVLSMLGGVVGLGFAGLLVMAVSGQVEAQTGVALAPSISLAELELLAAVTLAGALAGLVPALSAYRTEAAQIL